MESQGRAPAVAGPSGAGCAPAVRPAVAGPWGLYVHVPFCPYKCDYCDFVAVRAGERVRARIPAYLRALWAEAVARRGELAPPVPPSTVFYGGGTPTAVPAGALADLHRRLAELFGVRAGSEVSVEANPGTVDGAALAALRAAGVNRLSLGLQAWQDGLLRAVGRLHTRADFVAAFRAARRAGFDNVNVDLIFGLPGQTEAQWTETLDAVAALGPEHISAYALQVEPGTVLARRSPPLPGEEAEASMYRLAQRRLAAAGYRHYEVSNWALPGAECRHNLLYWHNDAYLGLGAGAASHWAGRRWTNTARLDGYLPVAEESREPGDTMMMGLRLLEGVDRTAFRARFGCELGDRYAPQIADLVRRGLLEEDARGVRLTAAGLLLGNRVFAAFV